MEVLEPASRMISPCAWIVGIEFTLISKVEFFPIPQKFVNWTVIVCLPVGFASDMKIVPVDVLTVIPPVKLPASSTEAEIILSCCCIGITGLMVVVAPKLTDIG